VRAITNAKRIKNYKHNNSRGLHLGLAMMLIAFLCFSLMDSGVKWLVNGAMGALQIAFIRYFFHLVCALVVYAPRSNTPLLRARQPLHLTIRSLLLLAATTFNFSALSYLPLNLTIAIFNAAPFVICLLSIPILGEKVGARRFTAVLVGFLGVLIILNPRGQFFSWPILLSLASLMCASGYFVMNRLIAGNDGNAVTQIYTAGIGTLALAPLAWSQWIWPQTATQWIVCIGLGTFGMLGHTLLRAAHTQAEASVLAPTTYSQIIYITILSWWLFETTPDGSTIVGTTIIVGSGLYLWARERQIARPQKLR